MAGLREKSAKVNEMPCHHKLESYLDAAVGEVCQLTTITCCKPAITMQSAEFVTEGGKSFTLKREQGIKSNDRNRASRR
ncbi:MAG: hypothetical protein WA324_10925 [Bryobacteraceae bacterium]